ncbi:hypothetical protein EVAR_56108_1 [Eumeta japonica]|uniref:Uncharacterized protein n=1 Tax=Eumeta variegata TaxID=151549 RepID=A0A4C1YFX3_EUMVA|nr:hypothetical protein EVAR_56108_1 [Eumeta japonica]
MGEVSRRRGRDYFEIKSVLKSIKFISVIIQCGTAPSGVFTIEIAEEDDGIPQGKEGSKVAPMQRLWRQEVNRDYDESTMIRHSESTTRSFHINERWDGYGTAMERATVIESCTPFSDVRPVRS